MLKFIFKNANYNKLSFIILSIVQAIFLCIFIIFFAIFFEIVGIQNDFISTHDYYRQVISFEEIDEYEQFDKYEFYSNTCLLMFDGENHSSSVSYYKDDNFYLDSDKKSGFEIVGKASVDYGEVIVPYEYIKNENAEIGDFVVLTILGSDIQFEIVGYFDETYTLMRGDSNYYSDFVISEKNGFEFTSRCIIYELNDLSFLDGSIDSKCVSYWKEYQNFSKINTVYMVFDIVFIVVSVLLSAIPLIIFIFVFFESNWKKIKMLYILGTNPKHFYFYEAVLTTLFLFVSFIISVVIILSLNPLISNISIFNVEGIFVSLSTIIFAYLLVLVLYQIVVVFITRRKLKLCMN